MSQNKKKAKVEDESKVSDFHEPQGTEQPLRNVKKLPKVSRPVYKDDIATFIPGFPTRSEEYIPKVTMHEEPISTLGIKLKLDNVER